MIPQEAHLVVSAKTAHGDAIANRKVTATDEAGKIVYVGSNASRLLPPGTYVITVSVRKNPSWIASSRACNTPSSRDRGISIRRDWGEKGCCWVGPCILISLIGCCGSTRGALG